MHLGVLPIVFSLWGSFLCTTLAGSGSKQVFTVSWGSRGRHRSIERATDNRYRYRADIDCKHIDSIDICIIARAIDRADIDRSIDRSGRN
ncbi:hypothetical protein F5B17DRAFT_424345, partial [Nemania serpens]